MAAVHAFRLAAAVLLIGLSFLLVAREVRACSCRDPGSPSEALTQSRAVFAGKVVSIRDANSRAITAGSAYRIVAEFKVYSIWKGPNYETIYVTTNVSGASCGVGFARGGEYLVYSWDGYGASLCSRTRPLRFAQEDLDELGEGRLPDPATSAPTPVPNATLAVTRALTAERPAWLYLFQGIVVTVLVAIGWVIYGTSQGSMAAITMAARLQRVWRLPERLRDRWRQGQ